VAVGEAARVSTRLRGGTVWQGQTAIRISVSSWAPTEDDVERGLAAYFGLQKDQKSCEQY
jgi:hypothetical protein